MDEPLVGIARTIPSGVSRRDQHIVFGLAAATVALAVLQSLTGLNPDVLLAAPALLLFLPLLAGRYLGEHGLARLAARWRPPRSERCRARGRYRGLLACWLEVGG